MNRIVLVFLLSWFFTLSLFLVFWDVKHLLSPISGFWVGIVAGIAAHGAADLIWLARGVYAKKDRA